LKLSITKQIAKHFREVHSGDNWNSVNLKDSLNGIDWEQATTQVYSFNTIATLVFHINYYISSVIKVFEGQPLNAHDKYSFDLPPLLSRQEWEALLNKSWTEAEKFATLIGQLPDHKYGNYYRNIQGIIEHTHYHLGQIVLIKRILQVESK
jgi:hypothetical protein